MKHPRILSSSIVALLTLAVAPATKVSATTLLWDANGNVTNQTDGAGTWLAANQWWNGTSNTTWNNATPDNAVIGNGGAGGIITTGNVTAGTLAFNSFTGTYTLNNSVASTLTINSGLTVNNGAGIVSMGNASLGISLGGTQSWTHNGASSFTVGGAVNAGANGLTLAGSGNGTTILSGGLTTTSGALTISKTGTLGVTISGGTISLGSGGITVNSGASAFSLGAATIAATQSWVNNSANVVNVTGALAVSNPLTLTAGTFKFASANTGAGGVVVNGGTLQAGSTAPAGTGILTLTSGKFSSDSTTGRAITNDLVINGPVTLGDVINSGGLSFGTNQSVTTTAAITSLANVTFGASYNWGSNAITYKGPGIVTPASTVASATNSGTVAIGETVASGSLGGRVQINGTTAAMQTALGSGNYTINYGGVLTHGNQNGDLNPSNAITVNNGGTFSTNTQNAVVMTNALTFRSGATISVTNKQLSLNTANVSFPTAGVFSRNGDQILAVTGAYPTITGTLAFGGTSTAATNFSTAAVISANRTLAFNGTGNGGSLSLGGVTLSADLTIAGSGVGSIAGFIPQATSAINLGAVTSAASPSRALVVATSPLTQTAISHNLSNYTGTLSLNSGILRIDNTGTSTKALPNVAAISLNGGTLRISNGSNTAATLPDAFTVTANGGTIEQFQSGNGPKDILTLTGAITGSTGLSLRYGGATSYGGMVLAPASPSSFSGGYTVTTSSGRGRVSFNANSLAGLTGSGASTVTVGDGVAFGVDAIATLTGNLAKFNLSSGAILTVDGIPGANIDLSAATGINRDIWIGAAYNQTYTGTLTPFGSTYKFAIPGTQTLTLGTANQLSGLNGLTLAAPLMAAGASDLGNGTLTLTAAQSYNGNTSITGTVRNALTNGGTTGSNLIVGTSGNLSGSTNFIIEKGSSLTLSGTNGQLSGANPSITVRGNSVLRIGSLTLSENNGVTNRIHDGAAVTLGSVVGGGGSLTMVFGTTGAVSETLGSLNVNFGENSLSTSTGGGGAGGTLSLTFGGSAATVYTRSAGATVNIATTAGFTTNFTNAPTTNVSGSGGAAILVGAFLNNAGFASASNVVGNPTYTVQNAAGSWSTGQNMDTSAAITGTTASGNTSINSLRGVNGGTFAIGASATDSLTISSGMILLGGNGMTINGPGSLKSGNAQDLVINMSGSNVTIAASIAGGLPLTVTNSGGSGNLHLTNAANGFAGINVYGNRVLIETAGAWGNAGPINISGSSAVLAYTITNANKTLGSGFTINSGTIGGGTFMNGGTGILTVQGTVALNGLLNVAGLANGTVTADGTIDFQGNISGPGVMAVGYGNRARVLLSGSNNSGWTGGLMTQSVGTQSGTSNIFGYNANSFGSGPMVLNRAANIYFDTNAAGAVTLPQDVAFNSNSTLSFLGMGSGLSTSGGTAPLTLAGRILGSGGLTFQGAASSDSQVSEIVLSNTVVAGGAPTAFSFGTATSAQNFANGQGGIQLGVTGFRGTTSTSTALDRVEDGTGLASQVLDGALGFVRFDGAQSFIPGAVGAGYISAIRRAGGGQDGRFGYLLTGSGAGSTYTLPEGKSFVIGSLGTGGQQYGTLGVTGSGTASATLVGSAKLSGFGAGDINVHANAVGDTQSLNLLARNSTDTFNLGVSGGAPVVFTPTYGDSGFTSSVTLMADRTGATTLQTKGDGTINLANVTYKKVDGATDASANFGWDVTSGTLQAPTAASLAGSLKFSGGTFKASGSFDYTNPVTVSTGGGTINTNGNNVKLSGSITGSLNLIKSLSGDLEISGSSNSGYTGTTFVNGGSLTVNGSIANSAVQVASGAFLKGNGTVGATTIAAGGTLAPGNSIGTLNTGDLSLGGASAHLDIELGRTVAGGGVLSNDRVFVTGAISLTSGADLKLSLGGGLFDPIANDVMYLAINDSNDAVSGVFTKLNNVNTTLAEGSLFLFNTQQYKITYLANYEAVGGAVITGGNDIALIAVPEPSSWAMLVAGLGMAIGLQRLRRRAY